METIWMIQKAFGDDAMSATQIKVWYKCFKGGQKSVESDLCSGSPTTSRIPENVERVWAAINKDQQLTVWELEADLGIPKTTVSFCMKCVMAKFVPWLLLPEQKEHRATVANDLIQPHNQWTRFPQEGHNWRWIMGLWLWSRNEGPVISVEVTWFSTPKEGMAKPQQDQDHVNCVFDWEAVVNHEYATPGQTINEY